MTLTPTPARTNSQTAREAWHAPDYLVVDSVDKSYGPVQALDAVSFSLVRGEMLALLGPSGCGKTTLLNVMSGFLGADRGTIHLDGVDVSQVAPHRRNMPMVFQSYALFPHMTVGENIAFGLRQRKVPKAQRRERVAGALEMVRLPGLEKRYPSELSGGQCQRVALARCLVVRPPVLLLDEPLSNLDAQLRAHMRDEMNEILRTTGTTSVFVTHDQSEGLAIADKVLVLREGVVEQEGPPQEVYERPVSKFTADFTGVSNLWAGRLQVDNGGLPTVETELGTLQVAGTGPFASGDEVVVAVRPDRVGLVRLAPGEPATDGPTGTVASSSYLGRQRRVHVDAAGIPVTADVDSDVQLEQGQGVRLELRPECCLLVRP